MKIGVNKSWDEEAAQNGLQQGRSERDGGGVLEVYVDDGSRPRTPLQVIFSSLKI